VEQFAGGQQHFAVSVDIIQRYTARYHGVILPSIDALLIDRNCSMAHVVTAAADALVAFNAGHDVAITKVLMDGQLHSCTAVPYMSWGGDRMASDLTRGLPWNLGAELGKSTLDPLALFRGMMDEVAIYAGAVLDARI